MSEKPILCLDFDGVIHSYVSGWKGADVIPDPPVEGVFEFLYEAIKYFNVQIFSSRSGQDGGIEAMREWLEKWEVYHIEMEILSNPCFKSSDICLFEEIQFPTEKPPAMLTIDDRALTFTGKWLDFSPKTLLDFQPWNKHDTSKGVG